MIRDIGFYSKYMTVDQPIDSASIDVGSLSIVERLSDEAGPVAVEDPKCSIGPARCALGARMQVADKVIGYLLVESATAEVGNCCG